VNAFEKAGHVEFKPDRLEDTLTFVFETRSPQKVTASIAQTPVAAEGLWRVRPRAQKHFNPNRR
jgi:homogentisate 1,2-dioxygenase